MGIWIFRILVVLGCTAIVYFQISPTPKGLGIGATVGLAIAGLEFLVAEINLLNIISGILGASGGIILAKIPKFGRFANCLWKIQAKMKLTAYFKNILVVSPNTSARNVLASVCLTKARTNENVGLVVH